MWVRGPCPKGMAEVAAAPPAQDRLWPRCLKTCLDRGCPWELVPSSPEAELSWEAKSAWRGPIPEAVAGPLKGVGGTLQPPFLGPSSPLQQTKLFTR